MAVRQRLVWGFASILALLLALVMLSAVTGKAIDANLVEVTNKRSVAQRAGIDFRGSTHRKRPFSPCRRKRAMRQISSGRRSPRWAWWHWCWRSAARCG